MTAPARDQRDAWLRDRMPGGRPAGIGGSDCGKILSEGAFSWWSMATGRSPPLEDNEALDAGREFEGGILNLFERWHLPDLVPGATLERSSLTVRRHPTEPWAIGSPDAVVRVRGQAVAGVDAKNWNFFYSASFGDEGEDADTSLPIYPAAQGWHYCWLLNVPVVYFAVWSGRSRVQVYPCAAHPNYERDIVPFLRDLWQHVLDDTPPEVDGSDAATAYVLSTLPVANGETADLNAEAEAWAEKLALARAAGGIAAKEAQLAQQHLLPLFAGARWGRGEAWNATRVDVEAGERLDEAAFRAARPDVWKQYAIPTKPYTFALVKRRKEKT